MSRVRHYTRSLASGYAAFAANTVFSLVSVPLALHYLSKAEFGLWALTTQIAGSPIELKRTEQELRGRWVRLGFHVRQSLSELRPPCNPPRINHFRAEVNSSRTPGTRGPFSG